MIQIVSSYTHLAGHYWSYTVALAKAYLLYFPEQSISVHASVTPRESGQIDNLKNLTWKSEARFLSRLISISYRNRHWESSIDKILRFWEFHKCLNSAIRNADGQGCVTHIHCIESRHRLLCAAVLKSQHHFSTLCVGPPGSEMPDSRKSQYLDAFRTGRLTFIVETEAIRSAWEPIAGDGVIHIPAAVTEDDYKPRPTYAARRKLNLPVDRPILLFFGTHRKSKDYESAILAAKQSKSQPYLLFVGPLISDNDPGQLLDKHSYHHGACWEGYYPESKLPTLFDACDALVLPYNAGYEKGSAVLLQACQYLKPIIAIDTGIFRDFIQEHKCGLLYKSHTTQGLAQQYDKLAGLGPTQRDELMANLIAVRGDHSWKKLIERYQMIFKRSEDFSMSNHFSR